MSKQITVLCDLGKWRRVRCRGTYEKGFRPIEMVDEFPSARHMTMANNKYWNVHWVKGYGYKDFQRVDSIVHHNYFPYPKHEAARRAKQK